MKVLLIDGNNLGWRSFGMAPLSYEGQRTEVISIGLSMIHSYLMQFDPDRMCIAWDGGRDERRMRLYPDYKRRKKELTKAEEKERDMFFDQMNRLIAVLRKLGVPQYQLLKPRREADDVIASLVSLFDEKDSFTVVSNDQDFYQLLQNECDMTIYSPTKKKLIKREDVEKELGVPIGDFIDYKALVGDPSDNLPGIKGIGPKWAPWVVQVLYVTELEYIRELTGTQKRMLGLLLESKNMEMFELMKELIQFIHIEREELNRGKLPSEVLSLAKLQENMIRICQQYGLARIMDKFTSFIAPFEVLYKRRNECA